MARRLLVAGNWKMYKTPQEGAVLAGELRAGLDRDDLDVLVVPTFLALTSVAGALEGCPIAVGGQNLFWEKEGAFTGEVSGPMLKAAGASHVLVAHSERRQYFGETNQTAAKRIAAALDAGLTPVYCFGETLEERESGRTNQVLTEQLAGGLAGLDEAAAGRLILAYEPVWAIGTGKTATVEQAQETHSFIRSWLAGNFQKPVANSAIILYGGSVKPANAAGLLSQPDIDGALVGGASLTAESFLGIIKAI
ncbi:MAG: triose-phosphate isomerase [Deltaproteobacteria bacterium]|nr:triose-phosphate isomerase [Deltaproteobacteria bacterium]